MATSNDYIEFVAERVDKFGAIRTRKMFGEYMVYLNDRPIFTVCDNTVFVKKFPELSEIMNGLACGFPYDGAKEVIFLTLKTTGFWKRSFRSSAKLFPSQSLRKRSKFYKIKLSIAKISVFHCLLESPQSVKP